MGAYSLDPGEPLTAAVQRVARDELERALAVIDADAAPHDRVHDVRRRCKKLRALVRLVRVANEPLYRDVDVHLRDAGRVVSATRDTAAAVETHESLLAAQVGLAEPGPDVVGDALRRRAAAAATGDLDVLLQDVRARLAGMLGGVGDWCWPGDGAAVVTDGVRRTYARARRGHRAAGRAASTTEDWHDWRKRVKYHRHHVGLLRAAWPELFDLRERALHDLTDLLGQEHDLAVLHDLLAVADDGPGVDAARLGPYLAALDRRRTELRADALRLGARLHAVPPRVEAAHLGGLWRVATTRAG